MQTYKIVPVPDGSGDSGFLLVAVTDDGREIPGLVPYRTQERAEAAIADQQRRDQAVHHEGNGLKVSRRAVSSDNLNQ